MKWFMTALLLGLMLVGIGCGQCLAADFYNISGGVTLTTTTEGGGAYTTSIPFTLEGQSRYIQKFFYVYNPTGAHSRVMATVEASVSKTSGWTAMKTFSIVNTSEAQYDTLTDDTMFPYWRVRMSAIDITSEAGAICTPEANYYGETY